MHPKLYSALMSAFRLGIFFGLVGMCACTSPQINPSLISAPINEQPATVVVTGNEACHPSQDLPSHKAMKKVSEKATSMGDVYGLLAAERHDHAGDMRDYNALWDQCVGPAAK